MKFKSLGIIFKPKKKYTWSLTHCMLPTVIKLNNDKIRIFFGSRNKNNISSIGFVDLNYKRNKFKIVKYSKKPVLKPGLLGSFDDNGVLPSCIIKKKKIILFILYRMASKCNYKIFFNCRSCKV